MSAAAETVRAPRLTQNRLADLEAAVIVLNEEIDYFAEASKSGHLLESLRTRFADKAASLTRARDWIQGKVAAERAQRGDS